MHRILLAGIVLVALVGRAPAQAMLDLIPREAAAAIAIRDLDDLIKKGDQFLTDSQIKVPFRPSALFNMANGALGVGNGLNKKGSAAILLLQPTGNQNLNQAGWENLIIPVIPFTDADVMADNFGIPKGRLGVRGIQPSKKNNLGITAYATRTKDHIFLSGSEKTLERIVLSKSVAEAFTPTQRKQLNESDILLLLGRHLWEKEAASLVREFSDKFKPGDDPQEVQFAADFAKSLADIQHAVIAARVDDGLGFHFIANVPKGSNASKLFQKLRGVRPSSTLKGLPDENIVLAQAFSTDEKQHALLARGMFNFLFEELLMKNNIIAPVDRLNYLDIFHEVWRKLDGHRLALYQTSNESKLGLFSVIAILDTRDAPQFLRDMKTLMKMADAASLDFTKTEVKDEIDMARLVRDLGSNVYAVRQSASTKLALIGEPALPHLDQAIKSAKLDLEASRRARDLQARIADVAAQRRKALLGGKASPLFPSPTLTFVPGVEKRAGHSVDAVHIKLAGLEKADQQQYRQLLGADWDKMRLAVVGKQVVVMLGTDTGLFEAALKNVQAGSPGLAESKRLAKFQKRQAPDRLFEFHMSTEGMMRLTTPNVPRNTEPALTSLGLSLDAESLQLDVWTPMAEVRAIARKAQEGMQ